MLMSGEEFIRRERERREQHEREMLKTIKFEAPTIKVEMVNQPPPREPDAPETEAGWFERGVADELHRQLPEWAVTLAWAVLAWLLAFKGGVLGGLIALYLTATVWIGARLLGLLAKPPQWARSFAPRLFIWGLAAFTSASFTIAHNQPQATESENLRIARLEGLNRCIERAEPIIRRANFIMVRGGGDPDSIDRAAQAWSIQTETCLRDTISMAGYMYSFRQNGRSWNFLSDGGEGGGTHLALEYLERQTAWLGDRTREFGADFRRD